LLARRRPCDRLLEQAPHRPEPSRRDPEALLGEPRALDAVAADAADDGVRGDLDVEADRRVPVRVGVRERRVVDDLDAGRGAVDEEERRPPLPVLDDVRHDDEHGGDVARGDEPLLAGDTEAARRALGRRRDPRRVRAGVLLGDRVGVLRLAAQRRAQVPVDLRGTRVGKDVVGARDVPREAVRRAAELLLDGAPLDLAPALAAVLDGVQAAVEPRGDRRGADRLDLGGRQPAAGALGHLLARDQLVVDEAARATLHLALAGAELERRADGVVERRDRRSSGSVQPGRRRRGALEGAPGEVPPPPTAGQPEQEARVVDHDVRHDGGGAGDDRVGAASAGEARRPARSTAIAAGCSRSGSGVSACHCRDEKRPRTLQMTLPCS
jgi:hypothetical protein